MKFIGFTTGIKFPELRAHTSVNNTKRLSKEYFKQESTRCPKKNVPLGEVCPSPKGTFFPVHVCIMLDYAIGWLISPSKKLSYIFLLGEKLKF